jgi:hypothetical protein
MEGIMAEEKSTEEAPEPVKAVPAAAAKTAASGIGIAALVVGIVAILSGWVAVWGLIVGAGAIVLGIIALKKSKANKGFGIAGIILGAVAALTSLIFTVFWIIAFAALGTAATISTGTLAAASKDAQAATAQLSASDAIAQKQIDAKKDFNKGETATFGTFTVKVNSVNLNYVPDNTYEQASSGSKYVVVNVTVTNPGDSSVDVNASDLELNADGVANTTGYGVTVDPSFAGGSLDKGASSTGNIVYTVPTGASTLKLQYSTTVYTVSPYQVKNLTYTLAL